MHQIEIDMDEGSVSGYVVDSNEPNAKNYLEEHTNLAKAICFRLQQRKEKIALLKNINVDEDFRGQGIGSCLLAGFLDEASSVGATCVILIADDGEEQREGFDLQSWYEANGFLPTISTGSGNLMVSPADLAQDINDFFGVEDEPDDSFEP